MKILACFIVALWPLFPCPLGRAGGGGGGGVPQAEGTPSLQTHAVKINIDDMKKAESFYVRKLGFEVEDRSAYPTQLVLKTGGRVKLILNRVARLQKAGPLETQVGLTLQVNDLDQTVERLQAAGVHFVEGSKRREAVGNAITVRDPFGRKISLMHHTASRVEPFKEPRIYNFGVLIPDMNAGRDYYSNKLGFVVRSEKYLPLDLPLGHKDNSFGFMLHYRPGVTTIKSAYPRASPFNTMLFTTDNLRGAMDALKSNGIKVVTTKPGPTRQLELLVFEDPFGNIFELMGAAR